MTIPHSTPRSIRAIVRGAALVALIALVARAPAHAYEFYALGDSLTDNGRVVRLTGILPNATSTIFRDGRSSNGPVWAEYLPALIGAHFATDDDYAINGALSGHGGYLNIVPNRPTWRNLPGMIDEVDELLAAHPRLQSNDLVAIWIGTNDQDLTKASLNGIEPFLGVPRPATTAQTSAYTLSNVNSQMQRLIDAGGRQFLILNLNDDGGTRAGYVDYNSKLPGDLVQYARQRVNVHLFDVAGLLNQMRGNPGAYGLNSTPEVQCLSVPACNTGSVALQNTYLTADGTHVMTSVHAIIARYIANQLDAPAALAGTPELGLDVARASALQALAHADGDPGSAARVAVTGRLSVFADGGYTRNFHGATTGVDAFDSAVELLSLGAEYRASSASRFGALFSSGNASASVAAGQGDLGLHSYRLAFYHAFDRAGLFARTYIGAGWDNYGLDRQGVLAPSISASTNGFDFGGLIKAGYLFPLGIVNAGPVADLGYTLVVTRGYTESGDAILVQNVGMQRLKGLSGGAGLRVVAPLALRGVRGGELSAEATLRRDDFNDRTLVTSQRYAPELPIETAVDGASATYGRLALAASVQVTRTWSGKLAVQADVGNAQRRSYNLFATLGATF